MLPCITPEIALARAHFRLGVWLRRHGHTGEGDAHLAEASRLHPDSWNIWRQAADLDEVGKASGEAFWLRVQALGDRPGTIRRPICRVRSSDPGSQRRCRQTIPIFAGSIPELYDRHLGPVIFEPYATAPGSPTAKARRWCDPGNCRRHRHCHAETGSRVAEGSSHCGHRSQSTMLDHAASKSGMARVTFRQARRARAAVRGG